MQLAVQNSADIPNKHIRFIKWRLYEMNRTFSHLLYAHVFITSEGKKPKSFTVKLILGIPGNDIILKKTSENISHLCTRICKEAKNQLGKFNE